MGKLSKTAIVYLAVSVLAIAINKIYAIFGHGVSSASMSLMFLYPLLGGAAVFFVLRLIAPYASQTPRFRLHYNLYNSGIAALTAASFFKGIFDIAGTASGFIPIYFAIGWSLIIFAITGFLIASYKSGRRSDSF